MDTLARSTGPGAARRSPRPGAPPVPDLALALAAPGRRRVRGLRMPPGTWRWWETAIVATVFVLVVAAVLALDPSHISAAGLTRRVTVVGNLFAFAASLVLYLHWRLVGGGPLAWLILGVSGVSFHLLTMAALAAANPEPIQDRPGVVLITRAGLAAGVLILAVLATRGIRIDPLVAGCGLGATVFVGRCAALVLVDPMHLSEPALDRLTLIGFLLDITLAVAAAAFPRAPRWVCRRLAVALAALAVGHVTTYPVPSHGWVGAVVASTAQLVAVTLLMAMAVNLLRMSMRDNSSAVRALREQLLRTEATQRDDQARLHEIRATIAGIAHAAELIHRHRSLAVTRRDLITDMMTSEIQRLDRLTSTGGADHSPVTVDVDSTVEPLVTRIVAQGHRVCAEPSGQSVLGCADDVAEIVNVLLDNAVHHGQGADMMLTSRRVGDLVEIAVSDAGPGVPPDARARIFDWGCSGPASEGDGIGLHVARALAEELGGELTLVASDAPGATFVLRLPAPQDLR